MKRKILSLVLVLGLGATSMWAKDRSAYLDEASLKEIFTFKPNEKLKYAKCPMMYRGKMCFYIWGEENMMDKTLPMPIGDRLQITYEKNSVNTFNMFTQDKEKKKSIDVDFIEGLGAKAAWLKKRKSLLVLLENKMLISFSLVNEGDMMASGEKNLKEKLIQIAKQVIEKEKK